MFYRRKVILALLQVFGNRLENIKIQKLLFLFCKGQAKPEYEFIPYKYGSYSFSLKSDITTMEKKGLLLKTETDLLKNDKINYFELLRPSDQDELLKLKRFFGSVSASGLIKHTYKNYPFWAIKSIIASEVLNQTELDAVKNSVPRQNETVLFTIGYEGNSLENYLLKLLKNNVKVLIDVRRNPLSMKFGFSKSLLSKFCNALDIDYVHMPEVGIESESRQDLISQADYDKLFENYKVSNLTRTLDIQTNILNLLKKEKRIALTCFEADICQCHRKPLAEAISNLPGFKYEIVHI